MTGADHRRLASWPPACPAPPAARATEAFPMKIGLIAMSGVRVRTAELAALGVTLPGFVRRGRVIAALPSLGLLTVAGLTPPGHEVTYLEVDDLRASAPCPTSISWGSPASPPRSTPRTRSPSGSGRRASRSCWAASTSRSCPTRRSSTPTPWSSAARRAPGRASWPTPSGAGSRAVYAGARERVFEPGPLRRPAVRPPRGAPVQPDHRPDLAGLPARVRVLRGEPPDHLALQPEAGGPGDRRDPRGAPPRRAAVLRAGGRQQRSSTGAGRTSSSAP